VSEERITVTVDRELESLVPTFLANRRGDVGRLRDLLANGDFAAIQSLGHNIRGAGGPYGFPQVSVLGAAIESAAAAHAAPPIAGAANDLERFLDRVDVVYA